MSTAITTRRTTVLSASVSSPLSDAASVHRHHREHHRECVREEQHQNSSTRQWLTMLVLVSIVISSPSQQHTKTYTSGVHAFQQLQQQQQQQQNQRGRFSQKNLHGQFNSYFRALYRTQVAHPSPKRRNNKMFPLLVINQESIENYGNSMAATNASSVFEEPPAAVAVATSATTFEDVNSMTINDNKESDDDFNYSNDNILVRSWKNLRSASKVDKATIAKLGIAFGLTYNIISNINGSISLSMAWYIASKKTGLSPLAPGQWKSLLAAYGKLYMVICLMRPLRLALAVAMTRKTENFLQYLQNRLGCTRAVAVGLKISLGLVVWGCMCALGVSLASAASGVPIWKTAH